MATKTYLRKIIILATVLLTLGILLYLQNLQKMKKQQFKTSDLNDSVGRENMLEQLPGWNRDQIAAIVVEQKSGEEDSRLELQSEEADRWKLRFPEGIPVRPGAVDELVRSAFGLWGKKLPGSFDLSQEISQERYGFNQVLLTIDYFGQKPGELLARILVGGEVPGIGGYYATVVPGVGLASNEAKIGHLLFRLLGPLIDNLAVDANALRKQKLPELVLFSSQQQHLNILELRSHSNVLRIEFKNEELKYSTLNELQNFVMTKPYITVEGVDHYQLEQLLKNMPNPVRILEYMEDQPKDLKVYGLDKAQRQTIYAEDNLGNMLNLWLGKEADVNSVYAMQAPYGSVFTVSKDILVILNFTPFLIVDKFVALIHIDKIDQMRLLVDEDADYNLQILRKVHDEREDAPSKTEVGGSKLQENTSQQERRLGEDMTKELYQKFLNLFYVGEVSDSFFSVDKVEISMIYLFRDGRQRRIDFYNYSIKDYYVVSNNGGKATFLTEKLQLEQLRKTLGQVLETGQLNIVK